MNHKLLSGRGGEEGLAMRFGTISRATACTVLAAWLLAGCSKSVISTDRYAVTKLHPQAALLFFFDSQSEEKSSAMEARIVRSMSRALVEANAYVRVLRSKEFCPEVVEPFYSPEDILLLLRDAQFKERIEGKRIQYIVLVYVSEPRREWSSKTYADPGGMAIYNKRETEHYMEATLIDAENTQTAGTLEARCSASAGYGVGVAAGSGLCCIFPLAWYGGDTEDAAIRALATGVAKFLTDQDAVPDSKRPE